MPWPIYLWAVRLAAALLLSIELLAIATRVMAAEFQGGGVTTVLQLGVLDARFKPTNFESLARIPKAQLQKDVPPPGIRGHNRSWISLSTRGVEEGVLGVLGCSGSLSSCATP
jgi:hypothetical protein